MSEDPGPRGTHISEDPGPRGAHISEDPGPRGTHISEDPGPRGAHMSEDPGPRRTHISEDPGPRGTHISEDPGPRGTHISEDPCVGGFWTLPSLYDPYRLGSYSALRVFSSMIRRRGPLVRTARQHLGIRPTEMQVVDLDLHLDPLLDPQPPFIAASDQKKACGQKK